MEANIKFKYKYEDFQKAQFIYLFRIKKRYKILLPLVLLVLIGVISLWILNGYSEYMMTISIIYGLALFIICRAYVLPLMQFKKNPRTMYDYCYTFNTDGIELLTQDVSSKYQWSFFSKVVETSEFFLIFSQKIRFIIIPKRAFNNDLEIDNIKSILTESKIRIESL